MKCSLKNKRRKAQFGIQEAATLAAAGINAAATIAGAATSAKAAKESARQQVDAMNNQTNKQIESLKEQNDNNNQLQMQNQEFIAEQNDENRQIQKDMQLTLQMLAAQQDQNDRLEASKIKVKNGGCKRNKKEIGGLGYTSATSFLRGSNLPFKVENYGGVQLEEITPEGYELYELIGNDHNHYHKTKNDKKESGVTVKFADGETIEGEGNQNTNNGEKMLVTPNNAYFISKHTLKGYNPSKAVDNGEDPLIAFAKQEIIKDRYNISDNGKKKNKNNKSSYDDYFFNKINKRKCGGKKAYNGTILESFPDYSFDKQIKDNMLFNPNMKNGLNNISINSSNNQNTANTNYTYRDIPTDFVAPSISAVGNLAGNIISTSANRRAANMLSNAYLRNGELMANAYNSLKTVDLNGINDSLRNSYKSVNVMPVLQAPVSFADTNITNIDRSLQRRLANDAKYSASSANANSRMGISETQAQDDKNKVYSADQQQMQQIRQANAKNISDAAKTNAMLATEANKNYTAAYLDLLKYNNNIENQKILGSSSSISDANMSSSDVLAQMKQANGTSWGRTLATTSQGFANTMNNLVESNRVKNYILAGATPQQKVELVDNRNDAKQLYNTYLNVYNSADDKNVKDEYSKYLNILRSRFNF